MFNQFDQDNEAVSFRIMLGPAEHFGHSYGGEATRLVIDYALSGRPAPERRSAFQVEGVLRDALRWDGEWIDATMMSIVAG